MRILKIFAATMLVALAVAMPAAAQTNATQQAYSLRAGITENQVQQPKQAQSGTLPFTGLQLGVVVGAGIVLLGAGLTVRRLSRPSQAP